jgi:Flp pilus assembly protein TadD
MTTSTTAAARRARRQQFMQLYGVALVFTLLPYLLAAYQTGERLSESLGRAQDALLHNRLDEAIGAADETLAMDTDSDRARGIAASAQFERYWVTQAEVDRENGRELVALLQDSPEASALTARGNLALIDGDTVVAVALLRQATVADPSDAYAHHQLGFSLNATGRTEEAVTHLRRALELSPDMAWVQSNILVSLIQLDRCDEAIPGLQREVAARCHNEVGIQHYNARRFADARRRFELAVQIAADSGLYHAHLAAALLESGNRKQAAAHARQSLALGVKDHWVFGALGIQ